MKEMITSIFSFAFKSVVAAAALVLYSYAERLQGLGVAVSLLVAIALTRQGGWYILTAPLVVVSQALVLLYEQDCKDLLGGLYHKKNIMFGLFVLLLTQYVLSSKKQEKDDWVHTRPYEKEIRAILFQHDHTKLHTVDTLLQENRGHEEELLQALKREYGIADGGDSTDGAYGGPGSNSAAPWETISKLFQDDIALFVEDHDPGLKRYLPKMLVDYSGKEEQLYKLLHREYSVPYIQPQYARKYNQAPITVAHDENDDTGGGTSSRSPFRTKDETMLEMARREARAEIQTKLDRYGR
jgi:hypothetical protein